MASYAIGDIQGCFDPFQKLLEAIKFDPVKDTLWLTGDLVNRGPKSLEVLSFVRSLGDHHRIVLGNHDLHFLARAEGVHPGFPGDTLAALLAAPECASICDWLSSQPLLQHDPKLDFVMTHAGLAPYWPLDKAKQLAKEVETVLQGTKRRAYLSHLYGNTPDLWDDNLTGWERLRCITNYFTRMRFCFPDGRLSFADNKIEETQPWYMLPNRCNQAQKILFGHWAALGGKTTAENVFALDTGCVWGFCLTAFCLEEGRYYRVSC